MAAACLRLKAQSGRPNPLTRVQGEAHAKPPRREDRSCLVRLVAFLASSHELSVPTFSSLRSTFKRSTRYVLGSAVAPLGNLRTARGFAHSPATVGGWLDVGWEAQPLLPQRDPAPRPDDQMIGQLDLQ